MIYGFVIKGWHPSSKVSIAVISFGRDAQNFLVFRVTLWTMAYITAPINEDDFSPFATRIDEDDVCTVAD